MHKHVYPLQSYWEFLPALSSCLVIFCLVVSSFFVSLSRPFLSRCLVLFCLIVPLSRSLDTLWTTAGRFSLGSSYSFILSRTVILSPISFISPVLIIPTMLLVITLGNALIFLHNSCYTTTHPIISMNNELLDVRFGFLEIPFLVTMILIIFSSFCVLISLFPCLLSSSLSPGFSRAWS